MACLVRATAIKRLLALIRQSNLDCLCLAETKSQDATAILNHLSFSLVCDVPARGSRGSFALAWRVGVDIEIQYSDSNLFHIRVLSDPPYQP